MRIDHEASESLAATKSVVCMYGLSNIKLMALVKHPRQPDGDSKLVAYILKTINE